MSSNAIAADLAIAHKFLHALDPRGVFTFQTFDDNSARKSRDLARVLHGTLDQHAATLAALNEQGAGVFVMVNEGDLQGRAATNVRRVRALFVDLDGAPLEPVLQCASPPHIIVDSSPGRYHAYWLVTDAPLQEFRSLQQMLAASFGGDVSVNDLSRVMRLPGFWHCKREPTLTLLHSVGTHPPYAIAQLVSSFSSSQQARQVNAGAIAGIHVAADPHAPCAEGERNSRLTSLAGRWLAEGYRDEKLLALARDWNARLESPLPDTEVAAVCQSMQRTHQRNHAQQANSPTTATVAISDWEEPVLFSDFATRDIPARLLPGNFGLFAEALARETETPEALPLFAVLGTISAALAKRFVVSPWTGWEEPLNIYALVALPPANNKSLVLNRCTVPLREWETEQRVLLEPELKKQRSDRRNQEKYIESLRAKAVHKNTKPADREALFREITELEAKLPEPKALPQLFANDATPESLAQSVDEQGGRFAIVSDEGGITETLSGLYTGGIANIDLILKGIDGGDVRLRRKDRSIDLKPFLTFMLAVQPKIIQNMGDRRAFQGNGLLERFLYVVPQSKLGFRTLNTQPVPREAQLSYCRAVRSLLEISSTTDEHGRERPRVLTLSPDALALFREHRAKVETYLRPGGELHACLGWGGKLPGYVLRLAGLLHVAEHGLSKSAISKHTLTRALAIGLSLVYHARAAFNLMGLDQPTEDAKAVLEWIKSRRLPLFRKTECHRDLHGRFDKAARLNDALRILAERNIVTPPERVITTTGKRPTTIVRVNPLILAATS